MVDEYLERIGRAVKRLLHEPLSIVDAALASGFGSQEAFTQASATPPHGMEAIELPAARYAVFTYRGRLARLGLA